MQHTLESHGVLAFLGSRPSAAPSLSADPTKRAEVLAYEDGLSLACFLLAEHCGSDATSCLVSRNPRASWRRLRRMFEVEDLSVGVKRMQYWMSCRYEEGTNLDRWLKKMGILRDRKAHV